MIMSCMAGSQEAAAVAGSEVETLDPVSDLRVNAFELVGDIREQQRLLAARAAMPCHRCGVAWGQGGLEFRVQSSTVKWIDLCRVYTGMVCRMAAGSAGRAAGRLPAVP